MIHMDITAAVNHMGDRKYIDTVKIKAAEGSFIIKAVNGCIVIGPAKVEPSTGYDHPFSDLGFEPFPGRC